MPEGPEVRIMAEKLQKYLPRYYITKVTGEMTHQINIPFPRQIKGVTVKGKKLIFILDNDIYLVSSLGMTGHWDFQPAGHTRVTFYVVSGNNTGSVYYDDTRKFGSFDVYIGTQELINGLKNKVGPDLLGENITYEQWRPITLTASSKEICQFLIDQKYFSGVGNEYRSEIAYHARLDPTRTIGSLNENELMRLYNSSIIVLRDAYYKLRDRPNEYTAMVYEKIKDPHNNPIQTKTCKDKRKLYWVQGYQM
jgi:formamidopyrimidine-DNA glycosylase